MRTSQSRLLVLCAVVLLLLAQNVSADGNQVNITFICYDGSALAAAEQSNPYNASINVTYISRYADFSNVTFENQDVIFSYMLWSQFEDIGEDLESAHENGTALIDISSAIDTTYINTSSYAQIFSGTEPYNSTEEKFFYNMGTRGVLKKNAENFLIYLAKTYGDKPELTGSWVYEDPVDFPEAGLYHPDARSSTNESEPDWFENTTDYLEWYSNSTNLNNSNESRHIYDKSKPTIGIWFHASDYTGDNLEVIDALIRDLEEKGCNVIAGFDTFNDIHNFYFDENGASCCHHTCGNPLLHEFVSGMVSVPGYAEQIKAATQVETETETQSSSHSSKGHQTSVAEKLNQTARASSESQESNHASTATSGDSDSNQTSQDSDAGYGMDSSEHVPDVRQSSESDYVEGYEMQKEEPVQEEESGGLSFSGSDIFGILFVVAAVGGIYMGFRKKKM